MEDIGEQNGDQNFPTSDDQGGFRSCGNDVLFEQFHMHESFTTHFDVSIDEVLPPSQWNENEGHGQLPLDVKSSENRLQVLIHRTHVASRRGK